MAHGSFPNVDPGAENVFLHLKPKDNYSYFRGATDFNTNPVGQDLWSGLGDLWFSPTQVCLTLKPSPAVSGNNKLVVTVKGLDQFGAPVREQVVLTSVGVVPLGEPTVTSKQGTRSCYCNIESIIVDEATNVDDNLQFRIGIGRTKDDVESPPPLPFNSYRIPIGARLRRRVEVNAVQVVFRTNAANKYWFEDFVSDVDLAHNSVQVVLADNKEHHLAVIAGVHRLVDIQRD